ncbi:EamA family transporter [Cellulomonas humilata]|uniref:EamA family transporter n=1 Tax=Cellulomonas humilata TaxID=144055 RepID=A0A7Y6DVX7_9CELL|nr:EamA family transporter [Cellulomonas humilata]NUU16926.1 EamA family transporter [Cellulomonas humilata]
MTSGLAAALLAAIFYGVTPVCARRAIRLVGYVRANAGRLAVATAVMAVPAFALGRASADRSAMFAVAGVVGFGLGGLGVFRALSLVGAPLTSLVVETTAAVAAGVLAWVWFADALTPAEVVCGLVILGGVVLGLLPYVRGAGRAPRATLGVALAGAAGVAQAVAAVISRESLLALQKASPGTPVTGRFDVVSSAAFDRLVGGLVVALVALAVAGRVSARRDTPRPADLGPLGNVLPDRAAFWITANALLGPVLGVTSMVWALQTLQPGIAQAVAATAPLVAIPFARWLEGYRPPRGYYAGAVVAVAGLVALALVNLG